MGEREDIADRSEMFGRASRRSSLWALHATSWVSIESRKDISEMS